jgi:hypothetical protein
VDVAREWCAVGRAQCRLGDNVRLVARLLVLGSIVAVAMAGTAWAADGSSQKDRDQAEELIKRALEYRRRGDESKALPLLEEAHRRARTPRTSAQLGLCQQGLGQWAEAEVHLINALEAGDDPWIKKNDATLRAALATVKEHVGRVEVIGEPEGAEVIVNGTRAGRFPLAGPVAVSAGEVMVELRAPGYAPATKSLRIEGGQYQKLVFRLERPAPGAAQRTPAPVDNAATAAATDSPRNEPGADPVAAAMDDQAAQSRQAAPSPIRLAAKWVAWGAGAVALGVGAYGIARNSSVVSSFDAGCGIDMNGVPRSEAAGRTDKQCADLKASYERATVVGYTGFISAAVLIGAGFLLWATEPSASDSSSVARLSCVPSLGPRLEPSLGCALLF